jgi:hypothetical protein
VGTKHLALVVCFLGCGQVEKAGHDATIDSPAVAIDAAPDAFTCQGTLMACGNACFDLTTDNNHCGMCTKMCLSNEGCSAGSCIDATASCLNIKALNPNAPSGPYIHSTDNAQFFCDMSKPTPVQYDALAMGRYNATYTGYSIINAAQLTDPVIQQAFIWAFNKQNGMPALETWSPGNVCATASPAGGSRLEFAASLLFPSQGMTQTNMLTAGALYGEDLVNHGPTFMIAPLATSFFTTYPPSEAANCADSNNPALFFKKE